MVNNLKTNEEIHSVFLKYLEAYLSDRDLDSTTKMFSPNITGYGTGFDEKCYCSKNFIKTYARDLAQMPQKIPYQIIHLQIQLPVSNTAIVSCELNLETYILNQTMKLNHFRLSTVWIKYNQDWLIEYMHISLPTEAHGVNESYPIKELEDRNKILQRLVDEKTKTLTDSNKKLIAALNEIKTLQGILPICSHCKKIRDDKGCWNNLESYIQKHSEASFTHGMCPKCLDQLYGDQDWYIQMKKERE